MFSSPWILRLALNAPIMAKLAPRHTRRHTRESFHSVIFRVTSLPLMHTRTPSLLMPTHALYLCECAFGACPPYSRMPFMIEPPVLYNNNKIHGYQ